MFQIKYGGGINLELNAMLYLMTIFFKESRGDPRKRTRPKGDRRSTKSGLKILMRDLDELLV
jgi:hypothetical protein